MTSPEQMTLEELKADTIAIYNQLCPEDKAKALAMLLDLKRKRVPSEPRQREARLSQ